MSFRFDAQTGRLASGVNSRSARRGTYLGDGIVVLLTYAAATLAGLQLASTPVQIGPFGSAGPLLTGLLLWSAVWYLCLRLTSVPDLIVFAGGERGMKRVATAGVFAFAAFSVINAFIPLPVASDIVAVGVGICTVTLVVWRWFRHRWLWSMRERGKLESRALLVGDANSCTEYIASLKGGRIGTMRIVGVCSDNATEGDVLVHDCEVLGNTDAIVQMARQHRIDCIVVAPIHGMSPQQIRELSWKLQPLDCQMVLTFAHEEVTEARVHAGTLNGRPFALVDHPEFTGERMVAKRALDLFFTIPLIVVLSPVFLVTILAIALTDGFPVFFTQERVGKEGKPFRMYKFRTMVRDAEKLQAKLLEAQRTAGNDVLFKMEDDPRITRVGRFLRRSSIDELPQLFNVLKGEMSLVGPRPSLEQEVRRYEESMHRRFLVNPGITGLWQVSGRSSLSWEESVRLDLHYVDNWNLAEDMRILMRTFGVVMNRTGAH